jgi:DNA-binding transcriptional ArsR family regulator
VHAFDVLGDPVRRRILELLGDRELTSGALCVAFGTDPAEARAAADRTTAFYTGVP